MATFKEVKALQDKVIAGEVEALKNIFDHEQQNGIGISTNGKLVFYFVIKPDNLDYPPEHDGVAIIYEEIGEATAY